MDGLYLDGRRPCCFPDEKFAKLQVINFATKNKVARNWKKAKIADLQSQAIMLRILKGRHSGRSTFKIKGAVIGVYIEGCLDNYLF